MNQVPRRLPLSKLEESSFTYLINRVGQDFRPFLIFPQNRHFLEDSCPSPSTYKPELNLSSRIFPSLLNFSFLSFLVFLLFDFALFGGYTNWFSVLTSGSVLSDHLWKDPGVQGSIHTGCLGSNPACSFLPVLSLWPFFLPCIKLFLRTVDTSPQYMEKATD